VHILINQKYLTYNNYKAKCVVGKRGIGNKRKEGDLITPKGKYKIKYILYRKDRIKKIQSKIRKIAIRKNMGWCDDPKSKYYNREIRLPSKARHEKLYKNDHSYDLLLVINYNTTKTIPYKGSAIFLHLTSNYKKTNGCIAVRRKDLYIILKLINKNSKIKIY